MRLSQPAPKRSTLASALCTLFLSIAALWNAHAQLYLSHAGTLSPVGNDTVSEYNSINGSLIKANLITGLNDPEAIVFSDNNLFVTTNISLPLAFPFIEVGEFDAAMGTAINDTQTSSVTTTNGTATVTFVRPFSQIPTVNLSNFMPVVVVNPPPATPPSPVATVNSVTTTGFVVNVVDTSTGLPADGTASWTAVGGTGGIMVPAPLVSSWPVIAVSGNNLFLGLTANGTLGGTANGTIGEYDITTGKAINANLITGLSWFDVTAITVSGNNLFVAHIGPPPTIDEYDATTGSLIKAGFILPVESPWSLAVSGNNIFVANGNVSFGDDRVSEYNATTGDLITVAVVSGLNSGLRIAVSGNDLFTMSGASSNGSTFYGTIIGEYDTTTATAINPNFITGLPLGVTSIAVASGATFSQCPPLTSIDANDTQTGGLLTASVSKPLQSHGGETTATVRIKNNLRVWLELTHIDLNPNNLPALDFVADLNAGTQGVTAQLDLLPPCTTTNPSSACNSPGVSAWTASFCGGGDIKVLFRFTPRSAIITFADGLLGRFEIKGKDLPGGIPSLVLTLSTDLDALPDLHHAAEDFGNFDIVDGSLAIKAFFRNKQEVHKAVEIVNDYVANIPGDKITDALLLDLLQEASDLIVLEIQTHTTNLMTIDISGH